MLYHTQTLKRVCGCTMYLAILRLASYTLLGVNCKECKQHLASASFRRIMSGCIFGMGN